MPSGDRFEDQVVKLNQKRRLEDDFLGHMRLSRKKIEVLMGS